MYDEYYINTLKSDEHSIKSAYKYFNSWTAPWGQDYPCCLYYQWSGPPLIIPDFTWAIWKTLLFCDLLLSLYLFGGIYSYVLVLYGVLLYEITTTYLIILVLLDVCVGSTFTCFHIAPVNILVSADSYLKRSLRIYS